ncbi:ribosomal large subunit pseudouridine synthase B [Motilibacter rhizosphaerae]|uniref:Pseudouridine synthase n=1 Tax=Motilibacter rhizosphaerae TaxID=598652 RepID=A0A4Q7NBE1_9ACTN|nr:pseudouridine synthase [Motilibacter rhizosphaerae]RZS80219.1 ribosomal large subunit pseudouridine synthase B [Motilibacter rhizosphaerae]
MQNEGVRLQKVLAAAGLGSRRACEVLIDQGRVEVDGKRVREQGMRVDPDTAVILVDGRRINAAPDKEYLLLHKPSGVVSAMSDPEGRPTLSDLVGESRRLFHVGRLDMDTEGLLIMTNDGELAHRLAHPSFEVEKTYLAEVPGPVPRGIGKQLREGVELEDGVASVDSFRVVTASSNRAMVEVVLHEGRKHVVRRMLAEVGLPVQRLVRVRFGPLSLGDLRPGKVRPLNQKEIGALFAEVALVEDRRTDDDDRADGPQDADE